MDDVPASDELATLLASTEDDSDGLADHLAIMHSIEQHTRRRRATQAVQHRSWKTADIFRSEPRDPRTSSPVAMPFLASSPPPTPSPPTPQLRQKRRLEDLDLGTNQLARPPKAQRSYYGIDIHRLLQEAEAEDRVARVVAAAAEPPSPPAEPAAPRSSLLWTEKYRARKFTDLIGDERTHRSVMHWLKRWDEIVFPGSCRPTKHRGKEHCEEKALRKVLLLTGPPGLGKTTLAHVCAKQAGYEVQEINASDERSSGVVKGRVRDMVGTENVRGVDTKTVDGKVRKAGKPVCVIIDEVDGVVTGSGGAGGEGGFIRALVDLILLDQKNQPLGSMQQAPAKRKKGDRFRLQRPIILICNDVYHPSLRPLRQSSLAEVIHVRKPPIQAIAARMHKVFEKEGIACDGDGVRRLCEATWGISSRREDRNGNGAGEGDMRGIMVVGEWVAGKLRAEQQQGGDVRLSRRWVEDNILGALAHGGGAMRGLGRGGTKDIVERVFAEGAGFPKSTAPLFTPPPLRQPGSGGTSGPRGVAEALKRTATDRLRELVDTHGEADRIVTDLFTAYPDRPFQDDTLLSKPDAAYDWLHFHDRVSSAVFSGNEWELAPYLSTPVLAFHHLFATPTRAQFQAAAAHAAKDPNQDLADDAAAAAAHPFGGPQASFAAHEATRSATALLQTLQSTLSLPLTRTFPSPAALSTELLPYVLRMLAPSISPVLIGGSGPAKSTAAVRKASEQVLVARAVNAMLATGIKLERTKVWGDVAASWGSAEWVYRMEPSVDTLGVFATTTTTGGSSGAGGRQRFAVRQALDESFRREVKKRAEEARMARYKAGASWRAGDGEEFDAGPRSAAAGSGKAAAAAEKGAVKRDFFGRPVAGPATAGEAPGHGRKPGRDGEGAEGRVWVTYHEGYSNAVRKPITLAELVRGM